MNLAYVLVHFWQLLCVCVFLEGITLCIHLLSVSVHHHFDCFCDHPVFTHLRDVRVQILIWFQTFLPFTKPHFRLLMQFECIEKHIFSGISDYFRLLFSQTLSRPRHLHLQRLLTRAWDGINTRPKVLHNSTSASLHSQDACNLEDYI